MSLTSASTASHCAKLAWGRFEDSNAWCVEHRFSLARWSGGHGGERGAERVMFTGSGEPISRAADEDDRIVIDRDTADRLGCSAETLARFDAD